MVALKLAHKGRTCCDLPSRSHLQLIHLKTQPVVLGLGPACLPARDRSCFDSRRSASTLPRSTARSGGTVDPSGRCSLPAAGSAPPVRPEPAFLHQPRPRSIAQKRLALIIVGDCLTSQVASVPPRPPAMPCRIFRSLQRLSPPGTTLFVACSSKIPGVWDRILAEVSASLRCCSRTSLLNLSAPLLCGACWRHRTGSHSSSLCQGASTQLASISASRLDLALPFRSPGGAGRFSLF
jgi:hypothetical protein